MKTLIRTIACLGVLGLMASCQMYEIDTQMTPEKQAASIRMVCDALPAYTVASTSPATVNFNVSSNTPWTITRSSGADWCTVTPSSSSAGALISDVVVSFENNTSAEDRTVTLTLKGDKVGIPVSIQITQARQGKLFITPVSGDYAAAGGPLTFTVQTNVAWEVQSSEGWLTFNRESGEPDPEGRAFTIIATAAASDVLERTATVTVRAGDDEESFDVTQKGVFDLTGVSRSMNANGDTEFILLRTDLPWTIMSDKEWLTFDEYSGTGDGSLTQIEMTALPNESLARKANVTVRVGGVDKTFEVNQNALVEFEIVAPESTVIDPKGEEITMEVKASMAWTPSTEVPGWTVTKVDDTHLKLTAPFNNIFVAKQGDVTIKSAEGLEDSVEFSQDVNFTFENAEVQTDGSVKIFCDKKSRVTMKDPARYVSIVLEMGQVNFDDKGEFVLSTHDCGELQCQIRLGAGKNRLRTNGDGTEYNTKDIGITVAQLNAITEYRMDFVPDAEDATKIDLEFFYNGTSMAKMASKSPFAGSDTTGGHYFFGTEEASSGTASWFIVKSCTPTFIAE